MGPPEIYSHGIGVEGIIRIILSFLNAAHPVALFELCLGVGSERN